MTKEHVFEFNGTKEEFLSGFNRFGHHAAYSDETIYYFEDYMVKRIGDEIHFGVARGGHSGGYWYIPTITELDGKMEFRGTIQYIGPGSERQGGVQKLIDGIELVLGAIVVLPIAALVLAYRFFDGLIRKLWGRPKPKEKSNEERLFDLMVKHFGCVGK